MCRGIGRRERIALELLRHDHAIAAPLDPPAGEVRQRRRAQRLAGAEAEARVVPGTAHRVADDRALRQRAAVVTARRADGVEVVADSCEEHRLTVRMAEQSVARLHLGRGDARGEIGTGECGVRASHLCALLPLNLLLEVGLGCRPPIGPVVEGDNLASQEFLRVHWLAGAQLPGFLANASAQAAVWKWKGLRSPQTNSIGQAGSKRLRRR